MSLASRSRERARELALGRTKPAALANKSPELDTLPNINITDFARVANEDCVRASRSDLAAKHGRLGAYGNWRLSPTERKQQTLGRQADKMAKKLMKKD